MARLTRKTSLEWKPTPAGALTTYRVSNLNFDVNQSVVVADNNYVGAFQSDKNRVGGRFTQLSFTSELRGFDNVSGSVPPEGALLKACGFSHTESGSPVSTSHIYTLGDLWKSPTGDLVPLTLNHYVDGLKTICSNAVGNVVLNFVANQIPTLAFTMRGLYSAKAAAGSAAAFVVGERPVACENYGMTIGGVSNLVVRSFSYDVGNVIDPRDDLNGVYGFSQPIITAREPVINCQVEMDKVTLTDFENYYIAGTELAFALTHNSAGSAGNVIAVALDAFIAQHPTYAEVNGKYVVNLNLQQSIDTGATPLTITMT